MARILSRLRVDEVSSVDRGAGEGVKVVLMKRDGGAPPQGSVREKYQFLIEQLRRGYPDMSLREARAEAWNGLSDDEQLEFSVRNGKMNKLDNSTLFEVWYRQLTPAQRQSYQRRQREIDRELAEVGTAGDNQGRGGNQFNGAPTSPNIAPNAPKAPKFEKGDTLRSIVKQYTICGVAKLICDTNNSHLIGESEFIQHCSEYASTKGQSLGKLLSAPSGEGALLARAASICRSAAHAAQAANSFENLKRRLG